MYMWIANPQGLYTHTHTHTWKQRELTKTQRETASKQYAIVTLNEQRECALTSHILKQKIRLKRRSQMN